MSEIQSQIEQDRKKLETQKDMAEEEKRKVEEDLEEKEAELKKAEYVEYIHENLRGETTPGTHHFSRSPNDLLKLNLCQERSLFGSPLGGGLMLFMFTVCLYLEGGGGT